MRSGLGLVAVAGFALSASGCYSKITAYEGNFTLGYMSPLNQVENFVKPIAPGAKLDLVVFRNGTNEKLRLVDATSSRPGVLQVVKVEGETLTVSGVSPGATELTISATLEGKRVTDKMFFHVAKPTSHALEHLCTEEPKAAYIRGTDVAIFHNLSTADKRPVVGYDYVPVTISPSGTLDFVAQPQGGTVYRYRAARSAPSVSVKSDIDGKTLEARIVEPADVKKGQLFVPKRMIAGGFAYAVARVEVADGTTVCSQNALTRARSLTPEICKVSAKLDDSLDDTNREQLAEIQALKFGTCRLEMTLPELGDRGIVLSESLAVGKVEYPPGGGGHDQPTETVSTDAGGASCTSRHVPMWPFWIFFGLAQALGAGLLVKRLRSGRAAR